MAKRQQQRALINNGSFSVNQEEKTEIMTIIGNNIKAILIDTPKPREMLMTVLITLNLFTLAKNGTAGGIRTILSQFFLKSPRPSGPSN